MLSPTGFSFRWLFCISEAPDLPKFSSYQIFTKTLLSHGKKNNINYWHERKRKHLVLHDLLQNYQIFQFCYNIQTKILKYYDSFSLLNTNFDPLWIISIVNNKTIKTTSWTSFWCFTVAHTSYIDTCWSGTPWVLQKSSCRTSNIIVQAQLY